MKHVFITGEIGAGKSYLIRRLTEERYSELYGFRTLKKLSESGTEGVYINPAMGEQRYTNENCVAVFSHEKGQMEVYPEVFETIGVGLLSAIPEDAVVIMDELGFLENAAKMFRDKVVEILDSDRRVYGVVKKRESHFLNAVRTHRKVEVFEVTPESREDIYQLITDYCRF